MSRKPLLQRLHESDPDLFKSISKLILLHLTKTAIVNCSTGSDGQIECASRLIEIDKRRASIDADIENQQKIVDELLAARKGIKGVASTANVMMSSYCKGSIYATSDPSCLSKARM